MTGASSPERASLEDASPGSARGSLARPVAALGALALAAALGAATARPSLAALEAEAARSAAARPARAVAASPPPERIGDVARGRALFERSCISCHGLAGRGDGPAAGLVRARPRDLADPSILDARSDAELFRVISEGGIATGRAWAMPRFGDALAALDVWDLVAFVRTLAPSVRDVLPGARAWVPREVVLPPSAARRVAARAGVALERVARRVVFFEACDAAGRPLGAVAFAPPLAVALSAEGERVARGVFEPGDPARARGAIDGWRGATAAAGGADAADATDAAAADLLEARLVEARAVLAAEASRAAAIRERFRRDPGAFPRGERVFLAACAACHGATGEGLAADGLAEGEMPARDLADPAFLATRTDADLAAAIRRGGLAVGVSGRMPATALDDADAAALVSFLRALPGSGEAP